ncbi:uncharacterized protein E0L32_003118 [Thyridium curvatum]|uniref:Cation efflux protein transmembrane domain-containing protein n=1 Tax=Thyridium curvatum TaxID=1093900 RepID=A0A507B2Y8_9PEZI|nr:uncharacterized protein E0L32_003118 [Thyridium curvatum]TPX17475.1 hypothetical protein E0L32_003118 [Thyridium curvatum]
MGADSPMSSPGKPPALTRVPSWRRSSFLMLQEDPYPLASKGQGALASLIKNRSTTSLLGARQSSSRDGYGGDEESGSEYGGGGAHWATDDEDEFGDYGRDERRMSAILNAPHMRSMRLIGNSNPRYRWERYWKTEAELRAMRKPIRRYYERTNVLVQQYLYIDRLLDSSLPHDLLNEYNDMPPWAFRGVEIPQTISEEPSSAGTPVTGSTLANSSNGNGSGGGGGLGLGSGGDSSTSLAGAAKKVKRTPKDIYRPTETSPLLTRVPSQEELGPAHLEQQPAAQEHEIPWLEDDDVDAGARIVTVAIWVNFAANVILLAGKIAVIIRVPSVSVLASLVDAALDFLSTVIIGITTWLISRQDSYRYPIGRRRLEPLGVLIFSIVMITSFVQVALEAIQRLASPDHQIIELGFAAIAIMLSTIVIKGLCWVWCRLVKNSSVQALYVLLHVFRASDAATDVIFNAGSIAFPIVGFYARIWWLDALGGLLLSMVVIFNWAQTSAQHIKNLSGFSATADQRNILLYLTMRFAKTIKQIQGLQAYHAGDKLNVEVDIVLDASTSLKDSHDLSESLQYVLESVPIVDRAFVHVDYATYNLPTHMEQQAR